MAYDTIKLKSPAMDRSIVKRIEAQCIMKSGFNLATGEILYEIFFGELLGSWDARISVIPKYEDYIIGKQGRPELHPCEPYLLVEASAHKVMHGHNVYGGPTDFRAAASNLVSLVEKLLDTDLPSSYGWTVHRVDVANVFRLSKPACKEFFEGVQLLSFPRRQKGSAKYAMAVYFAGKTTTVKFYHKGSEFQVHERSRLRNFFTNLYQHIYGKTDIKNKDRVERKLQALQRLADSRLRVEVEIHSDKLQYDFGHNPRVDELTDEYLQRIHDTEIERLLREGKQGMDTVRTSRDVLRRLKREYGDTRGTQLYGFWTSLCTLGDETARDHFSKATFYRNRKSLEEVGVSWRGSDIVVVSNDSLVPHDFAPIRTDQRLCFLPARNRPEYQVSRELMRLAA